MAAEEVVQIIDLVERSGIDVWLGDGGWGVDALLGRQSRAHDDLDLIVALNDVPRLKEVLGERGYVLADGEPPMSFELVDREGRQIDVHPVTFSDERDGIYLMRNGEEWVYPASGFAGLGYVLGRRVRCLTPETQVLCHSGYELRPDDFHDMFALHEKFGVELPEEYRRVQRET